MSGATNNNKIEPKEKPKEEPKKINKFEEKLKAFKAPEQPKKEEPKKINPFIEKNNKMNIPPKKDGKEQTNLSKKSIEQNMFKGNFSEKLKQMNAMFQKQSKGGGPRHRFTVSGPSTNMGNIGKSSNSGNLGIISEEPDKMKPGYDPAANLEKTLDSIVVKKDKKKKKKKPTFKE